MIDEEAERVEDPLARPDPTAPNVSAWIGRGRRGVGPAGPPQDRVRLFGDTEWEVFVQEWVDSLRDEHELVERCGGAGDNFVLIDSPLLVYEEPDADESSFPQDIKKHFWESVKTSFAEAQVVIIENSQQLPGDVTLSNVNVVLFTGNDQGRRGFIPTGGGHSP